MAFVPYSDIDNNLVDAGDLVSSETFGQLANNINYLMNSMPVGSVIPILSLTGVPTPDPEFWKLMDGSEITDQNSPLRNGFVANYGADGGTYLRGYNTPGEIGNISGSNTKVLTHNHGGNTQDAMSTGSDNADSDNDRPPAFQFHHHAIGNDLTTPTNFEPAHFTVFHYMKVK